MLILVSIGTVRASPKIGELLPPCDFFDCPVLSCPYLFFSILRAGRTAFHASWLRRRVSAQGRSFWGLERWVTIFGGIYPKNSPKMGVKCNFQPKRQNIKIAISPKLLIESKPNLRIKLRPVIALRGWSNMTEIESNMAAEPAGGHLEKIDITS